MASIAPLLSPETGSQSFQNDAASPPAAGITSSSARTFAQVARTFYQILVQIGSQDSALRLRERVRTPSDSDCAETRLHSHSGPTRLHSTNNLEHDQKKK